MITDENARLLVTSLRIIAADNVREAKTRKAKRNEAWRRHYEGRADAYRLAARWLEELIPGEANNDEKTTR